MRCDLATRWAGRMVWVWKCFDRDKAATFYHVSVMVRVGASHSQRTKYLRFCRDFINDLRQAHPKGIVLVGEKHPKNGLKVGNLNLTKNCTKNNGPWKEYLGNTLRTFLQLSTQKNPRAGGVSGQAFARAEQSKADGRAESQGNRGTPEAASIHGDAKVHRGLVEDLNYWAVGSIFVQCIVFSWISWFTLIFPLESSYMSSVGIEVFLAKKNRLNGLKTICFEYVQSMYYTQSITPVTVRVAQRLTEPQMEKVKEKMKQKAGTKDSHGLLCGFFFQGKRSNKKNNTNWVMGSKSNE